MTFAHSLLNKLHACSYFVCSGLVLSGLSVQTAFADFDDVGIEPSSSSPTVKPRVTPPKSQPTTVRKSATPALPAVSKPADGNKRSSAEKSESLNSSAPQQQNSSNKSTLEAGATHNASAPVVYSADSLEGSLVLGQVRLEGDVKIEQANAVMKADKAEIFSDKETTTPKKAIARGHVSLFKSATADSDELRALAREMEYFIPTRKVILKGDPKIWRGPELLQGKVIEVFLDTNEIKVKGARGVMSSPTSTPQSADDQKSTQSKPGQLNRKN